MKFIKKNLDTLSFIFKNIRIGFYYICLIFSRGFFFYLYKVVACFKKIFSRSAFFDDLTQYCMKLQEKPQSFLFLVIIFVSCFSFSLLVFGDTNEIVKLDESVTSSIEEVIVNDKVASVDTDETTNNQSFLEKNLFKKYGNMSINNINFNELKSINSDVVSWISVDGTNINYPIVQTENNDNYLSYIINKQQDSRGWTFMDYRNDYNMNDNNTIFYGHNLLNKTGFGSISNIFSDDWLSLSNHLIKVITNDKIFTYEIFSAYYSSPDNYYLQTNFSTDESYDVFLQSLLSKSEVNFTTGISIENKIITLSTCTEDNMGRKVVHAKLISENFR